MIAFKRRTDPFVAVSAFLVWHRALHRCGGSNALRAAANGVGVWGALLARSQFTIGAVTAIV